jgi:hypothetical protein
VVHGNVDVLNDMELAMLDGVVEITGRLQVINLRVPVSLPSLEAVFDLLVVNELADVDFVSLQQATVVRISVFYGDVRFPALSQAWIFSLSGEQSYADFSSLETVGTFEMTETAMTSMDAFTSLRSVGSMYLYGNDSLVDFDALYGVTSMTGGIQVTSPAALPCAVRDHLVSAGGTWGGGTCL